MRRPRSTKRGTARMREMGYIRVELWLKPEEVKRLKTSEVGWRCSLAGKCRSLLSTALAKI